MGAGFVDGFIQLREMAFTQRGYVWPVTTDLRLPESPWTCSAAATFDEDAPWDRCHAVALRRGSDGNLRSACAYLSTLKLKVLRKLMWLE